MRPASRVTLARTVAALGAVALGGCGAEPAAPGSPPDVPLPGQPAPVLISGRVLDSVIGDPVVGATVIANDVRTTTDSTGSFSLHAPSTFVALQVLHRGYADYRLGQTVEPGAPLVLRLPPAAPYTWACRTSGDSVVANVTDLQGRKTIIRRDTSGVVVFRGADSTFQTSLVWRWIPVDYLTYRVRLRIDGGPYDALRWRIYDAKGHVVARRCAALPNGRND